MLVLGFLGQMFWMIELTAILSVRGFGSRGGHQAATVMT